MTTAQMQALVTTITNNNFPATLIFVGANNWKVRSAAPDFTVSVNTIKTLADTQGVTAKVAEVEYS